MDETFINSYRSPQLSNNWLLNVNPLNKMNIYVALGLVTLFFQHWQVNVGITLVFVMLAIASGRFKNFIGPFLKLGLVIGLFSSLFVPSFGQVKI
ncbi:hypothetical protein [Gracilibacillus timonensis]|uniref:hypothetical protein n=1 Tax=Gracilibacillus timonensis TaxID=1816696 RepID=UPI000A545D72|nr:hypothetical protein [Gracilibacillus timonensis]